MIQAWISSLEFAGGTRIVLDSNSVLVIVGPNNAGKSATLNAIKSQMSGEAHRRAALTTITLVKKTALADIKEELSSLKDQDNNYNIPGHNFNDSALDYWWVKDRVGIGKFLTEQIISDLPTSARLNDCIPAPPFDARSPYHARHPFQLMYRDPELEISVSTVFRRAFKNDLVVHRANSAQIPLYVGERPALLPGEDRISLSYVKRIEDLDRLEEQGDGVRSFVSIVAHVMTEDRTIQLIDEPEAFLHPPQAKLVAENVVSHGRGRQTIVATHSSNVLQGLLSESAARVSVVRLTRSTEGFKASHLETGLVAKLWHDPILRFSNILDGLFHDGVIITEADADCRFYEAIVNASVTAEERPDIHYTYSGGKDRLPVVISALIGLRVPVATIVDFDVLNNDQPLRRIIEAHGGAWAAVENDWRAVKAAVESRAAFLGGTQFISAIRQQLSTIDPSNAVSKAVLGQIKKLARQASPWDNIKDSGLAAIQHGEPTVTACRLLDTLKTMGIFVAPHGEMEGFCPSIGYHGPRWVETVLQRNLPDDPDLANARSFTQGVVEFLKRRISTA